MVKASPEPSWVLGHVGDPRPGEPAGGGVDRPPQAVLGKAQGSRAGPCSLGRTVGPRDKSVWGRRDTGADAPSGAGPEGATRRARGQPRDRRCRWPWQLRP